MAVNWLWKNKCGEMTLKNTSGNKYTLSLYAGSNCMMVLLYEYKDEVGDDMYTFQGFWSDVDHLKRCMNLKTKNTYFGGDDENIYKDTVSIKLNIALLPKEWSKIVELFAKYTKAKVSIYYKEVK